MGQAIEIARSHHSVGALREYTAKSRGGAQARRLLVIALVLEGPPSVVLCLPEATSYHEISRSPRRSPIAFP
jgi:hypothetical protein